MADKRIFSIVVNGIKESVDAVDSLLKKLNNLEERINKLGKMNIKINVPQTISNDTTKTSSSSSNLAKLQAAIEKEKTKEIDLQNKEYTEQYRILQQLKQSNKELEKTQTNISKGIENISGGYENTLNGMRARLSDLKNVLANTELGTEAFEELNSELSDLTIKVKDIEQGFGVFSRDVGNYKKATEDLKDVGKEAEIVEGSIQDLENQHKKLLEQLRRTSASDRGFDELAQQVQEADRAVRELRDRMSSRSFVQTIGGRFGAQFELMDFNGIVQQFDDVEQAASELEAKVFTLRQQLEEGGSPQIRKEYEYYSKIFAELRGNIENADFALQAMVQERRFGGLQKYTQFFTAFTGLISVGQGLQGLFGRTNEEIAETLATTTSLLAVLQGMQTVQEELNKKTGLFYDTWQSVSKLLSIIGSPFAKLDTLIGSPFKNAKKAIDDFKEIDNAADDYVETLFNIYTEYKNLIKGNKEIEGGFNRISSIISSNSNLGKEIKYDDLIKEFEELYDAGVITKEELIQCEEALDKLIPSAKRFGAALSSTTKLSRTAAKAINGIGIAIKGLAKAFAIGLILEAVSFLISKFSDLYNWVMNITFGNDKLTNSVDTLSQSLDNANDKIERFNKALERQVALKNIDELAKLTKQTENYNKSIDETISKLKELVSLRDLERNWYGTLKDDTKALSESVDDIETFKKEYETLMKAVESGVDVSSVSGGSLWDDIWYTAGDARAELGEAQKKVINDIRYELKNLNQENYEEVEKFVKLLQEPMYAQSVANLENLYPDKEWATNMSVLIERLKEKYEELNETIHQGSVVSKELQRQINQNNISGIVNQAKREREQLKEQQDLEIEDAANNDAVIESLQKKHNLEMANLLRQQARVIEDINNQTMQNNLDSLQDGLNKRIKLIEKQRDDELRAATREAEDRGEGLDKELELSIIRKYNKLILDEERNFLREREDDLRSFVQNYRSIQNEIKSMLFEISQMKLDDNIMNLEMNLTYDTDKRFGELYEEQKRYYDDIYQLRKEYNEQVKQLELQQLDYDYSTQLKDEKDRYDERLKVIEDSLRNGYITQTQYNERMLQEETQHLEMMNALTTKYEQDKQSISLQYNNQTLSDNKTNYDEQLNALNEFYDEINYIQERAITKNDFNIINLSEAKKTMKMTIDSYKEMADKLKQIQQQLEADFKSGKISFIDYSELKKQLKNLENEVKNTSKDVKKESDELISDFINDVNTYVQAVGQGIQQTLSSLYAMQDAEFDRQAEELDRQNELLDEKMSEQEDIISDHQDKINSIEDELSTSRGERRQHLIDQLNAEKQAEIAAQQEKQKIQKQQEALEKKQDALDKKRRKEQKKRDKADAIISGALAAANGYATKPFIPVGLAMGSLAIALTAAQVAIISKTKYAQGGLLSGPSHSQGGIQIPHLNAEVEGGEYIINKRTTAKNLDLVSYINSKNKVIDMDDMEYYFTRKPKIHSSVRQKFAQGGQLSSESNSIDLRRDVENIIVQYDDRPITVSVVDINSAQSRLRNVRVLSGLNE